jgi:hypothetical protein
MPVDLLVDTGSATSVLDYSVYQGMNTSTRPELRPTEAELNQAGGIPLDLHGEADIEVQIGDRLVTITMVIGTLGEMTGLLGMDFMDDYDCIVHTRRGILQFEGQTLTLEKEHVPHCCRGKSKRGGWTFTQLLKSRSRSCSC